MSNIIRGKFLDESQSEIAKALSKLFQSMEKKGIEAEYTEYLIFSILGQTILDRDEDRFKKYIAELYEKKGNI